MNLKMSNKLLAKKLIAFETKIEVFLIRKKLKHQYTYILWKSCQYLQKIKKMIGYYVLRPLPMFT